MAGESDDTDTWVLTEQQSEEDWLKEAWSNLPFDMPYSQFRKCMLQEKRVRERGRWGRVWDWTWEWSAAALRHRQLLWSLVCWGMFFKR